MRTWSIADLVDQRAAFAPALAFGFGCNRLPGWAICACYIRNRELAGYYDGEIVRTVVPPASMPFQGRDNIYPIDEGVAGQLPVAAVAPGDRDYHGGKWAVNLVEWSEGVDPYLLTSEDEVLAAAQAGDVTITRVPGNDFKCPIQP